MLEKLPMPVVYSLRNGEIQISEVILEDVPLNQIRGVMITPKTELLINETYENFENAQAVAEKMHGELLSLKDRYILKVSYAKINETCNILKKKMGDAYPFREVDIIKGTKKSYWCQDYCQQDITKYFKKPFKHYGLCLETGDYELVPDCMYQSVRIVIRH